MIVAPRFGGRNGFTSTFNTSVGLCLSSKLLTSIKQKKLRIIELCKSCTIIMAANQLSDSEFPYSLYVPPHLHGRTLIHEWDTNATCAILIHDLEPSPSRCQPIVSHCLLYKPSKSTLNCHHSYDGPLPSQLPLKTLPTSLKRRNRSKTPKSPVLFCRPPTVPRQTVCSVSPSMDSWRVSVLSLE